jgi:hypothetical protein
MDSNHKGTRVDPQRLIPSKWRGRRPLSWAKETPALLYWPTGIGPAPCGGRSVALGKEPIGPELSKEIPPAEFDKADIR